jgi:hypothetical protein
LAARTRSANARRVGRPLDNSVERGYERLLIKDMTMASCFAGLTTMTLDAIRAEGASVRRPTVFAKPAVA